MVCTCGADGMRNTIPTVALVTRPCGKEEKQRIAEEDLDGQCQGRPEGETST